MLDTIILSPYELILKEIRKGKIDPYDVDVRYLVDLFREHAKELENSEYLREAGRFLEASAKLIKLQVEDIFPTPKPERKRITIKEVREVLVEDRDTYEQQYDLSWLWGHEVKVGRPPGAKDTVERRLTWKDFWNIARKDIRGVLHEQVDYRKLAKEVREKILRGESIRTIKEFIAYLHAYMEFEDVPELPELSPTVGAQV